MSGRDLVKSDEEWKTCLAASCMRPIMNHMIASVSLCMPVKCTYYFFSIIYFTVLPISSVVIVIPSGFCLRKQNHLGKSALLHSVSAGIKMMWCEDEEGKKNPKYLVMGIKWGCWPASVVQYEKEILFKYCTVYYHYKTNQTNKTQK